MEINTFLKMLITLIVCLMGNVSHAACDCQQRVGTCTGAINFVKNFGSAPSFGAEIEVYSSEKQCSKVEFLVDSTPYQTILTNKNKDSETVFGSKSINPDSIKYTGCFICKSTDEQVNNISKNSTISPFEGKWVGVDRNIMGFKHTSTYDVSVKNNIISGYFDGNGNSGPISGTISGNTAIIQCSNCFTIKWTLIDDKTIKYSYPFGSGTIRKE